MRYDPERRLIQIAEKGEKHVIDLREYEVVISIPEQIVEKRGQGLDKLSGVE
jgi:hypothetical protein